MKNEVVNYLTDFEVSERVVSYEKGNELETVIRFKPMNLTAEEWFRTNVSYHHPASSKMNGAYEVRPNMAPLILNYMNLYGLRITFWGDVLK